MEEWHTTGLLCSTVPWNFEDPKTDIVDPRTAGDAIEHVEERTDDPPTLNALSTNTEPLLETLLPSRLVDLIDNELPARIPPDVLAIPFTIIPAPTDTFEPSFALFKISHSFRTLRLPIILSEPPILADFSELK